LLVKARWFSPGIPASSTTKTGRHDIAETLPLVIFNLQKSTCFRVLVLFILCGLFILNWTPDTIFAIEKIFEIEAYVKEK